MVCRRNGLHPNQLQVPLTRHDLGQGSLAPSRLNREIDATMSPSDAAIWPHQQLWLPARGCPATPNRASQVPDRSFCTRCLLPPRRVRSVLLADSSRPMQACTISGRLATLTSHNGAESSSRDATARTFAFPSLSGKDRSPPLKGRLHDFRPITMMNTFQFIRTIKHSWRFPEHVEYAE